MLEKLSLERAKIGYTGEALTLFAGEQDLTCLLEALLPGVSVTLTPIEDGPEFPGYKAWHIAIDEVPFDKRHSLVRLEYESVPSGWGELAPWGNQHYRAEIYTDTVGMQPLEYLIALLNADNRDPVVHGKIVHGVSSAEHYILCDATYRDPRPMDIVPFFPLRDGEIQPDERIATWRKGYVRYRYPLGALAKKAIALHVLLYHPELSPHVHVVREFPDGQGETVYVYHAVLKPAQVEQEAKVGR